MTAKEIKYRKTVRLGRSVWVEFSGEQFDLFCEQLCKEQREICAGAHIPIGDDYNIAQERNTIRNAKMPEL